MSGSVPKNPREKLRWPPSGAPSRSRMPCCHYTTVIAGPPIHRVKAGGSGRLPTTRCTVGLRSLSMLNDVLSVRSFSSIRKDVGLGIGIDYGDVSLVSQMGGITVVGAPVVYA